MLIAACREDGVCRGSLWKQHCASHTPESKQSNNERSKCHEYCVLIGNTLKSYQDVSLYRRGEFPSSEVRIVGASSWNPNPYLGRLTHSFTSPTHGAAVAGPSAIDVSYNSPTFRIVTYAGTHVYCTAPSVSDRDIWLSALHSGLEASYTGLDNLEVLSQSRKQLSSGNGEQREHDKNECPGCGAAIQRSEIPPSKHKDLRNGDDLSSTDSVDNTDTGDDDDESTSDPWSTAKPTPEARLRKSPERRSEKLSRVISGSSVSPKGSSETSLPTEVFSPPRPQQLYETSLKYCKSCGAPPPPPSAPSLTLHSYATPLPHYNAELRVDFICNNCLIAQGLLGSIREWNGLYSGMIHERAAMKAARELCISSADRIVNEAQGEWFSHSRYNESTADGSELLDRRSFGATKDRHEDSGLSGSWEAFPPLNNSAHRPTSRISGHSSWHSISPSPDQTVTSALIQLLSTPGFATLRRRSRCLDAECFKLEMGSISGAAEFLENLDALCGVSDDLESSLISADSDQIENHVIAARRKLEMKKEALKIGGDLSAAIKLLHDAALGISQRSSSQANVHSNTPTRQPSDSVGPIGLNSLDMLTCLLELLLDLCEEGELSAVAFFWPQLHHIYLTMLPPMNATELCRVELVEDFLLTVATKYSAHLALQLVWGCSADLEEGLGPLASGWSAMPIEEEEGESLPGEVRDKIRFRRWCVLRFVCELESLLFGFEGGWGGGSVCLRGTLAPSEHQSALIRDAMKTLQAFRVQSQNSLTRSVRRDTLLLERSLAVRKARDYQMPCCDSCVEKRMAADSAGGSKFHPFSASVKLDPAVLQQNAHYLSSQLLFVRKLGEIAEKLRFLPVLRREHALVSELKKLNIFISEGNKRDRICAGDPMASVTSLPEDGPGTENGATLTQGSGFAKVVHLPVNEGHVFRSKARTPVLLLMEVLRSVEPCATPGPQNSIDDCMHSNGPAVHGDDMENRTDEEGEKMQNLAATENPPHSDADENQDQSVPTDVHPVPTIPPVPTVPPRSPAPASMVHQNSIRASLLRRLESPLDPSASPASDRSAVRSLPRHVEGERSALPIPLVIMSNSDSVQLDSSIGDLDSFNRSRLDSYQSQCGVEDMSELVHSAIQEKLVIDENKLKIPKLEELGGASDPVAAAVAVNGGKYDAKATRNALEVAEEYDIDSGDKNPDRVAAEAETPASDISEGSSRIAELPAPLRRRDSSRNSRPGTNRLHDRYNAITKNVSRKMAALGAQSHRAVNRLQSSRSFRGTPNSSVSDSSPEFAHPPLAALGSERREVLATILAKSMKGNVIAKGAAAAAQRAIQTIDRRLALDMIRAGEEEEQSGPRLSPKYSPREQKKVAPRCATSNLSTKDELTEGQFEVYFPSKKSEINLASDGVSSVARVKSSSPEEDDECLESLRLVLLQNRVAQGNLSPEGAARALVGTEGKNKNNFLSHFKGKDAGEVDPRLAGCGPLSHAVHSALQLWREGTITNGELLELARRDSQFLRQTALPGSENISNLMEDSAFWVRFSFGERWAEKKARIAARSPYGSQEGWDLVSVIVKSNDDLRQESFVMQLIQLCKEAFDLAGLELWLHPYRIVSTGKSTGVIELLKNTLSFDSLKKRPGYTGLRGHFERMTEYAASPQEAFEQAQTNFVRSLAAYSLLSYLFLFKDRHNGNLLLDTEGHVVHIDFGFVFGIAPGGSFSLESTTPFKLTEEMIEVMGGLNSPVFSEFVTLFCCGFLALQQHTETFCTLVEITCRDSALPCFAGKDPKEIVDRLRGRFCPQLDKSSTVAYSLDLIKMSLTSYGTRQYDFFQYLSNGIAT